MLVMDIGNSRIKWRATGQQSDQPRSEKYKVELLPELLVEWFDSLQLVSSVIVCSVATTEVNEKITQYFSARGLIIKFAKVSRSRAGVRNGYDHSDQLGIDRWVAMVAAYNKYRSAVCVIDAGTALTIDVVDEQGRHLGGLIMPGLQLMRQSLISGTVGINQASDNSLLLARNTADAVNSGCVELVTAAIEPMLSRIESQYGLTMVSVVTGGDAELVIERAECDLSLDQWLILDGLEQLFVSDA